MYLLKEIQEREVSKNQYMVITCDKNPKQK